MTKLSNLIKSAKWTNAKTYEKIAPHQYVLEFKYPELFKLIKEMISKKGVEEEFELFGEVKTYKYYHLGDYQYWIIDNVLNRSLRTIIVICD